MTGVHRLPVRLTGPLHMATAAGEPGCRDRSRATRLTGDPQIVECPHCLRSSAFNSALRRRLLRSIRAAREALHG